MANFFKKRGQKLVRKFSRASVKASEESKEHIKENVIERIDHIKNIKLLIFEWCLLVFALIMLSVTQAFWFSESYAETVFVDGGTYTEATLGDVNSMNPLFATTSSEKVLSRLMFATISTVDYSGHINTGLASSIIPSENGKRWTVTLRDGLKWSDGEPITVDDIVFTVNLIKNPAVATIYNANLSNVQVSVTENQEIIFDLPAAYADFITALNFPVVPKHILENTDPKSLIENNFSNSPVTSGAFAFNAVQLNSATSEKVIYLSRNPYYYKGATMLNSFAVHTFKTHDDIIHAINTGGVTATAELSAAEADKITSSGFRQKNSSLSSGAFIFLNTGKSPLDNPTLRNAIREGLNLEKIRSVAPDTIPLSYPLIDTQIKITKYPEIPAHNFENAKNIITELFKEQKPTLNIATVSTGYLPDVANTTADELRSLGFDASVSVYEENQEFITNIISKRNYDILIYTIEFGADPDLLPYYHSSQTSTAGLNLSNYRNALVDDLLLGARDTIDESLRVKKYENFLEYWVNEVPAIGLYRPNLTYFYNKNARTFDNNVRLVTAIDRFSDIGNWADNKATKNKTP